MRVKYEIYEIIINNPTAKRVGTSSFIQIQAKLAPYNVLALQVVNLFGTQVSFEW